MGAMGDGEERSVSVTEALSQSGEGDSSQPHALARPRQVL